MSNEDLRQSAKAAQQRDAGMEPGRSTYYASWIVEKTGGIARYVHGPGAKPRLIYAGPCGDCGETFVRERQPARNKVQGNGRWPTRCRPCHARRESEHNRKGAERKRAWRERMREEQRRQFGGKPPRGYSIS